MRAAFGTFVSGCQSEAGSTGDPFLVAAICDPVPSRAVTEQRPGTGVCEGPRRAGGVPSGGTGPARARLSAAGGGTRDPLDSAPGGRARWP